MHAFKIFWISSESPYKYLYLLIVQDSSEVSIDSQDQTTYDMSEIENLRIILSFTQSPLHQCVTTVSNPSKEVLETVRKAKLDIKTGHFSSAEDDIIRNNWETFLKASIYVGH